MKIQNVSSLGDLEVPVFGLTVLAGETVDVSDEIAAKLLEQPANWALVDEPKSSKKAAASDDPSE